MQPSPSLRVLQRHAIAILVIGVVAMVAAYGASFLVSPTYSSTARVLVRAREIHYLSANGQDLNNQPNVIDSVLAKALTQTSSGLVQSQAVAEQVVNELKLDRPRPRDESILGQVRQAFKQAYKVAYAVIRFGFYAEPPAHEGAVASVQESLSALPVKDSYLIDIQAKADDPELAAAMANSATAAFVDAGRARVRQEADRYQGFLKNEVDAARQRVADAQAAVRAYKEERSITNLDDQLRLSASGQDDGRKALDGTSAQLDDARARLDSIQAAMAELSPTDVSTITIEGHNSSTSPQTVTTESTAEGAPNVSTIETGRSRSTTTVDGVNSTQRSSSTTQASTVQSSSETHTNTSSNRVYQDMQNSLLAVQAEVAGLQARRDALAAALDERVKQGQALPGMDERLAELQLQVSATTAAYSAIRSSYESASVNAAQQTEEISRIDEARPPLYPEKPWRWLFGLVGLLLGIAAGCGLALLLQARGGNWRAYGSLGGRAVPPVPTVPALTATIVATTARPTDADTGLTGPSPA